MNLNINQLFKKENQYAIIVYFPDAKVDGFLPKFLTTYALKAYKIPIDSNTVFSLIDTINKKLTGGVGIQGTLTITDTHLEFKPSILNSLFYKGFELLYIPIQDITSVKKQSVMMVMDAIVVTTVNGDFKLSVQGDFKIKYLNDTTKKLIDTLNSLVATNGSDI